MSFKKKKIIMTKYYIFFLFSMFLVFWVYTLKANEENSCKYESEINECTEANKNWDPRSIEDFICIQSNDREEIAYQIILDKKFKEIDKEAITFLDSLEKWKDYYFWPEKKETYLDWVNDINEIFWEYGSLWNRYKVYCDPRSSESIIRELLSCSDDKTSTNESKNYFVETECMQLVEYKLSIYKKIANNVLQTNKIQVMKDYRKKQFQKTRTNYDNLIDYMYLNLDDITKINNQWNYKTEQCY